MRKELRTKGGAVLLSICAAFAPNGAAAQFDGYGPDAWQVTGVASDDWLNLRMGPGARYAIIGSFSARATDLTMNTCVPFMREGQGIMLSQAERDLLDLPARWCLMSDGHTHGWAAARFLEEASRSAPAELGSDAMVADAVLLVERLYAHHEQAMRGKSLAPLGASRSRDFFMVETANELASMQWQTDPLYDAQDTDIGNIRVIADPNQPMLRGLITVRAEFENFGQPQSVIFHLRADPAQTGGPVRILRINHATHTIP